MEERFRSPTELAGGAFDIPQHGVDIDGLPEITAVVFPESLHGGSDERFNVCVIRANASPIVTSGLQIANPAMNQ
jgi:hypothetical protein